MRSLAALLLFAGCGTPEYAVVHGQRVQRPTVGYANGDTFALEHRRAFPGVFDPSRGRDVDDGTLIGRVCGVDVRFEAMWYGSRLMLQGHGDVPWQKSFTQTEGEFQLRFDITELGPGHRRIRGRVPVRDLAGSPIIDLDVSPDALVGQIGMRRFTLAADGGYLVGRYERHGDVIRPVDEAYAIWGREELGTMVPADEALLLVLMLTCNATIELDGKMVRGFSLVRLQPKS